MPLYDAVFFDFDGVLVDSEPVHQECWAEVLAPLGIQLDWKTYGERYVGVDDRVMLATLCKQLDPPVPFERAWAQYPAKKAAFQQRMCRFGAIPSAAVELVADLHRGMKTAVVTSSARSEVEPLLEAAALLPHIDTSVYGEDVQRHKPDPEPYLLAASRLNALRPLVVEDSPAGLASGKAAGFDVLHIAEQTRVCELVRARCRL